MTRLVDGENSKNPQVPSVDLSTLAGAARREGLRIECLYRQAVSKHRGDRKGKRPGPSAGRLPKDRSERTALFRSLGLMSVLEQGRRRLSRDERNAVETMLEIESLNAAKKASEWLKSYPGRMTISEFNWEQLYEADRVGRLTLQGLTPREIQQKRGISKWRLGRLPRGCAGRPL